MKGMVEYKCRCGIRFYAKSREEVIRRVIDGEKHMWDFKCECGTRNIITVEKPDEKDGFLYTHEYQSLKTEKHKRAEIRELAEQSLVKLKDLI